MKSYNTFIVIALLLLRFPGVIFLPFFFDANTILNIYADLTYFLICLFIALNLKNLIDYGMTSGFLLLFLLLPVLTFISSVLLSSIKLYLIFRSLLGISLLTYLFMHNYQFVVHINIRNFIIFLLLSILLLFISAFVLSRQIIYNTTFNVSSSSFVIIFNILTQTTNAALSEEPLFRGIIYRFVNKKVKNGFILHCINGLIFMLAHVYYINRSPLSFLIVVPLGGFIFSLLREKTKSLSFPIFSHGIINGIGNQLAFILSKI